MTMLSTSITLRLAIKLLQEKAAEMRSVFGMPNPPSVF